MEYPDAFQDENTRLSDIPEDVWVKVRPRLHSALEAAARRCIPADFLEANRGLTLAEVWELVMQGDEE